MSTPVNEIPQPHYAAREGNSSTSDDEGTLSGEYDRNIASDHQKYYEGINLKTQSQEEEQRMQDDLAFVKAERMVSNAQASNNDAKLSTSMSVDRSRSRHEPIDQFDVNTNPLHEKAATFQPPDHPVGRTARMFKKVHESSFLVRYFTYIVPVVALILVPLMLGALVFEDASVGGVRLMWFSVWLEIIWLTLWGSRIVAKFMPYPCGVIASLMTNNSKKWRDMCKQLEIPGTLFFWALSVEISFLPIMIHNRVDGRTETTQWEITLNKVLVSILIGATLNFIEKIIIQLIAISFHLRTYADRIELNKFQIGSLVKLYKYSKEKIAMEDSEFEDHPISGPGSGGHTPMVLLNKAQRKGRGYFSKVGDVAGKVAGDFTGRQVAKSTHPRQLVLTLLSTVSDSQALARRLYRTFVEEGAETISLEDLKHAFDNHEEADSAFAMFDKDLNGDISMSELEAVCVEIGKERKSITASLKDLDSVVSKLDAVLVFFVAIVTLLVLISLISTSAAGVLTSAGSAVLALSWLFSSTAQEFLASCIFVLVKHPFDVGDRVYIYGNAGVLMKGDDFFVKEISLLYTEFKKMEGQIVQAPNSYLNTLFIQNMRRSGGLAEGIPLVVKFGTTLDQIDELRQHLLEFVKAEKREYQSNILTEVRDVVEAHSVNLNVVFFYKSNWQNELLRLQRRNKFICALMISMQEVGIEGPRMRIPGQREDQPFYYQNAYHRVNEPHGDDSGSGPGPRSGSLARDAPFVPSVGATPLRPKGSILHHGSTTSHARGESISSMSKRVDFSLGMKDVSSGDIMGDLYESTNQPRLPKLNRTAASESHDNPSRIAEEDETNYGNLGRSNSRLSNLSLRRRSTESQSRLKPSASVLHRNHLFSRRGRKNSQDTENQELMEQGMAEIPESAERPSRLDPRSGLIGTQAMRTNTGSEASTNTAKPIASGASPMPGTHMANGASGSGPEIYEMKSMEH